MDLYHQHSSHIKILFFKTSTKIIKFFLNKTIISFLNKIPQKRIFFIVGNV